MIEQVLTIGAFGFTPDSFIEALRAAGVDMFIDIRARRGVRGAEYAFANSNRLQKALAEAGIAYKHAKELAPTEAIRKAQWAADKAAKIAKRKRTGLGAEFISAYESGCLAGFDAAALAKQYIGEARRPVLFCVERDPAACHRSLVAPRLAAAFAVPVVHLRPPDSAQSSSVVQALAQDS